MRVKMKNCKNIIIILLLFVIVVMAIAYSAFATELTINGQSEIVGQWDIKITGIVAQEVSDGADAGDMQYTNTSATFNAKLEKPGDVITYLITIQNAGTIDATLNTVTFTADEENGSPAIIYTNTKPADELNAGDETTLTVTVSYDEETVEVPSVKTKTITGIIEYVQK